VFYRLGKPEGEPAEARLPKHGKPEGEPAEARLPKHGKPEGELAEARLPKYGKPEGEPAEAPLPNHEKTETPLPKHGKRLFIRANLHWENEYGKNRQREGNFLVDSGCTGAILNSETVFRDKKFRGSDAPNQPW
jgi:hypothetical protein